MSFTPYLLDWSNYLKKLILIVKKIWKNWWGNFGKLSIHKFNDCALLKSSIFKIGQTNWNGRRVAKLGCRFQWLICFYILHWIYYVRSLSLHRSTELPMEVNFTNTSLYPQTSTHVCLITDFFPGGELFALLDKQPMKIFKEECARYCYWTLLLLFFPLISLQSFATRSICFCLLLTKHSCNLLKTHNCGPCGKFIYALCMGVCMSTFKRGECEGVVA